MVVLKPHLLVRPATHPNEILESVDNDGTLRGWNSQLSVAVVSDNGVHLPRQAMKVPRHEPRLLNELELSLQISVQAHEQQAL